MGPNYKQEALLPSREDGEEGAAGVETPLTSQACLEMNEEDVDGEYFNKSRSRGSLRDQQQDTLPYLQVVQGGKFTPRPSMATLADPRGSKASFFGSMSSPNLASRPSMVSLKETLSKVHLELHPERGSAVANSMAQSMASIPNLATKVYIITQVSGFLILFVFLYFML